MSDNTNKFEIKKKSDIVKVVKSVGDYLKSEPVDPELYTFMESEMGMKILMENVMEKYSHQEFTNMVDVVDPSNREMWEDIYNNFANMNEEEVETES